MCLYVYVHVLFCTASCIVLQCVAVCCRVLQCVAECRRVLQCAAERCRVLQCGAMCCSVLHVLHVLQCVAQTAVQLKTDAALWGPCVAGCCSMMQCVAGCFNLPLMEEIKT